MIFIDSWIFIEVFSEGKKFEKAKKILESLKHRKRAVISPIVLLEVKYRIAKKFGIKKSNEVIFSLINLPNLQIVPVTSEVAILAADLRFKYYDRNKKPVSFGDMINLATAIIVGCEKLYSGDKDFEGVEEIKTEIV